jgi:hypothetical protein
LADQQSQAVIDTNAKADAGRGISFAAAFRVWLRVAELI